MATAKLHLICGNCGCDNQWSWQHHPENENHETGEDVYLICNNCSTIHQLSQKATKEVTQ